MFLPFWTGKKENERILVKKLNLFCKTSDEKGANLLFLFGVFFFSSFPVSKLIYFLCSFVCFDFFVSFFVLDFLVRFFVVVIYMISWSNFFTLKTWNLKAKMFYMLCVNQFANYINYVNINHSLT